MRATLTVMSGLPDQAGQVFDIGPGTTTLGRGLNCDVRLPDQNISRLHAELVWEGGQVILIHKSQVNRTLVNGVEISDRMSLAGGEEIQLADQVVLRLKIESAGASAIESDEAEPGPSAETPAVTPDPAPASSSPVAASRPARPVSTRGPAPDPGSVNLAIIGAGPAGIASGVRAAERGIKRALYERSVLADTIVRYRRGKS